MDGVVNFLKPPGMTGFDCAAFAHRLTGAKCGHAGTLDPEAAGVLPLLLGRASKLFDYIAEGGKTYLAEVAFGAATDTFDAQGIVVAESDARPDEKAILAALPDFIGEIEQVPPMYSALKRGGQRLYKLARAGKSLPLAPRRVTVDGIDFIRLTPSGCLLRVRCGKGVYIRSLAHD